MVRLFLFSTILLLFTIQLSAQKAEMFFEKGVGYIFKAKHHKALKFLNKSIELDSNSFDGYYNRGIVKLLLDMPKEAVQDFNRAIDINCTYEILFLQRGFSKELTTNYKGALADYTTAIELNPNFASAYYYRGALYELLSFRLKACLDFEEAYMLGDIRAEYKYEICKDDSIEVETHSILRLTKLANDESYGLSPYNPVKVGVGPNGGSGNQKAYLNLLRDGQGKRVKYERIGSCCPYQSENGFLGMGMLDQYEITYRSKNNKKKKAVLYLSFYDYEEPMIIQGFGTILPE